MQKPEMFTYETKYKTIKTSQPEIVIMQGIKCLDGGTIKRGGKFVRYMIRLDDKPELVARLEAYQKEMDAYNNWFAEQVEVARASMIIDNPANFDKAENDHFTWTYFDDTSGKTLTEKSTGKEIYQMRYTGGGDVPEDVKVKAVAFWQALEAIKAEAKAKQEAEAEAWANSPEGKAEEKEWERYEAFKREMESPTSDW